jgi:hypothetical protein
MKKFFLWGLLAIVVVIVLGQPALKVVSALIPPKLSGPVPIWKLFLFAGKVQTLHHEKQVPAQTRAANASHSRR